MGAMMKRMKMKKSLINLIILLCICLPFVSSTYFETYSFKYEDCTVVRANFVSCTFKIISPNSTFYFIESDENINERIRSKPFLHEVGSKFWPSNPSYGAYIFISLLIVGLYLLYKKGTEK